MYLAGIVSAIAWYFLTAQTGFAASAPMSVSKLPFIKVPIVKKS